MARHGENIYRRKDKRYEGRYIKSYDVSGKAQFGYVYAHTYREVKEKLAACKSDPQKKPITTGKTVGVFCDEWLTVQRSRVKPSTYAKYDTTVNRHLKPAFGQYLPQNLSAVTIGEYSYGLLTAAKPLAPKTVKDILTVLNAILKFIRKSVGQTLPDFEIVYPRQPVTTMRVLSPEEQNRLVACLTTGMDTVKFGILLALLTGMRIGELCALQWGDISLEEQAVTVRRTMQRLPAAGSDTPGKTHIVISETKSRASKRRIPLNQTAFNLCKTMFVNDKDAYILTGDPHKYAEPRTVQYALSRYTALCGIQGVHFHTLRHTFATRCMEVGFDVKSLSEILGHASVTITLDRYVHSSFELKRTHMDKLEAVGL